MHEVAGTSGAEPLTIELVAGSAREWLEQRIERIRCTKDAIADGSERKR